MLRILHYVPLAFLLACAPADRDDVGNPADATATKQAAPLDLTGHYKVTGPAAEPMLSYTLELSANETRLWWQPGCAGQGLNYRAAAGGVEFYDPDAGNTEPRVVCSIGYPEGLPAFWQSLAGERTVTIGEDRVVQIGTGENALVLTPVTDPLPKDLSGTWRLKMVDGRSTEMMREITLKADAREIWWNPRCAGLVMQYRMDGRAFENVQPKARSKEPVIGDVPAPVVCTIKPPRDVIDAVNALRAGERIMRGPENEIVISGNNHVISLSSQ